MEATENEYTEGDQPSVRRLAAAGTPCPFCGAQQLLISTEDVHDDDLRVELYCDNQMCDVREMTVIALRTNGPPERADVDALREIDAGVGAERLPDTIELARDWELVETHSAGTLARRRRPSVITVDVRYSPEA